MKGHWRYLTVALVVDIALLVLMTVIYVCLGKENSLSPIIMELIKGTVTVLTAGVCIPIVSHAVKAFQAEQSVNLARKKEQRERLFDAFVAFHDIAKTFGVFEFDGAIHKARLTDKPRSPVTLGNEDPSLFLHTVLSQYLANHGAVLSVLSGNEYRKLQSILKRIEDFGEIRKRDSKMDKDKTSAHLEHEYASDEYVNSLSNTILKDLKKTYEELSSAVISDISIS